MLITLYWWTMAPSISSLHDNVDGAELLAVAHVMGVAHPPGSAVWMPLGRAALEVFTFLDEPAARTNLASVLCMAAAGALIAVAARRWRPDTPAWACLLAGILAGTAPIPWAQGLVTEVLALQALLTALALVLAVDAARGERWPAFALVLGLMAWNHPTGLAVAVPFAVACLLQDRPARGDALLAAGIFLLPAAYTVAYLWLRADASIAWGETDSLRGIWAHLSGEIYRDVINRSPGEVGAAIPETLRRALRQAAPLAWLLAPVGALAIARARPAFVVALGIQCALLVVFISAYRATGRQDYLMPVAFTLALLAAWGAVDGWDWLRGRLPDRGTAFACGVLFWGLVGVWVIVNGDQVNRRGDTALRDEAIARLESAPSGTIIETRDDHDTFPLWYARVVLGVREDVGVDDVRGLAPVIRPR